jgi:serine/threonine protein kinase
MAGVYKAQHQLGQVVAIKVLPPSKAREPNLLGRFQREARLAQKLKHPNIVRTFQLGKAGELYYLVMEYLEGETLEDVLVRRGKLAPAEAVRLAYQVLQGLQHIHAQGLVHRDLKPSNMMLVGSTPDTTVRATLKILDIGLGRPLFDEGAMDITTDPGLTGEGVLLGTPDYMSPEQARDARSIDIRSDIYSMGCVLYHCLTGQPPFPDTNIISQMIRHATEPPRPVRELNPAVPDGLQQILGWMLAKEPGGRYPTPERAAQALQVFLAAGSEAAASPDADPKMRSYLTWLEVHDRAPAAPAAAPAPPAAVPAVPASEAPTVAVPALATQPPGSRRSSDAIPAAKPPSGTPPAVKPPQPDKPPERTGKRRTKRDKGRRPPPIPAAPSAAPSAVPPPVAPPVAAPVAPPPMIDVELVAAPPPAALAAPTTSALSLSRRDVVLFGVGVAAGAVAAVVGCFFALRGRSP